MKTGFTHKILVVDDETAVIKKISGIFKEENLDHVLADNGEIALNKIRNSGQPFSVIIARQSMKNMPGTELLKHAKSICPDTQRFLMTTSADIGVIINAVNKGSIQGYLQIPLETDNFLKTVKRGLSHFERVLENEKLFKLAKKQNTKLYELNCQFMENKKTHEKEAQELDSRIDELQGQIESLSQDTGMTRQALMRRIKKQALQNEQVDPGILHEILQQTVIHLHGRLTDLANRNGFVMPLPSEVKP